ncbi:DUF3857 domain-containing protein [Zunongwangia sp. H14]|uniref:DUF3857 domain-containing protein n=1 Tax=Zunongwangia sp. H14 TaxID=3240792 RepID=UPI00356AAE86
MSLKKLLLSIILSLYASVIAAQTPKIFQDDKPEWVIPISPKKEYKENRAAAGSSVYLLLDRQDNLSSEETFVHRAYKILKSQGIQEMSDFSVDFDPEYQRLTFHDLTIYRNGKKLSKLTLDNIQVVQRETNMERHLYDGSLTAIVNLSDIRLNDVVELSYTITGFNPVHKGKYQGEFYLEQPVPVVEIYNSVRLVREQFINYQVNNTKIEPEIIEEEKFKTYAFHIKEPETTIIENNTPAWYDSAAFVEFSQFKDWEEVANEYQKYYRTTPAEQAELKKLTKLISAKGDDTTSIIRFVQDEIRYLGFENGMNSHKPSAPTQVFERRYGDCKDKSFLLSELLQSNGIKAYPVLVNSYKGKNLNQTLASPGAFDHCIVQLKTEEGIRYIDPTISGQGGDASSTFFPAYGYGLVLKEGEKKLTKLPSPKVSPVNITETFILDDVGEGAFLEVETEYLGSQADLRRQEFEESTLAQIQQNYSNYYSLVYPDIVADKEIRYEDFRNRENKFLVKERYRIDSLWNPSPEDPTTIYAEFYSLALEPYLFPAQAAQRKTPYYIDPQSDITHHMIVFVPEKWMVPQDHVNVKNNAFEYDYKVSYSNARLDIIHHYKNLKDHVLAEEFPSYLADHKTAQQNISYYLTYNKNLAGAAAETSNFRWISLIIALLVMGISALICFKIHQNYDPPTSIQPKFQRNSIGGWLVLIAIGLTVTPLILLIQIFFTEDFMSPQLWDLLFSGGKYFQIGVLMLFELVYNCALLVFSILVAVVFYQKRTIAPRLIIIYYAVTLVITALDTFGAYSLTQVYTEYEKNKLYKELLRTVFRCIVWIPYFIYSKRVEETFVNTKNPSPEEEGLADDGSLNFG